MIELVTVLFHMSATWTIRLGSSGLDVNDTCFDHLTTQTPAQLHVVELIAVNLEGTFMKAIILKTFYIQQAMDCTIHSIHTACTRWPLVRWTNL